MAYDPHVVAAIDAELDAAKAPPLVRQAAYEAAIVESGVRNLNYGDRDSLGAYQQRPSQGWGTPQQILDPRYAASQFVTRAMRAYQTGHYSTAGQLAQAVQRSAFPARYDQASSKAAALANLPGGFAPGPGNRASAAGPIPTSAGPGRVDGGQAGDYTTLLQSLLSKSAQQAVQAALPAPAFTAAPALPHGFAPLAAAAQVQDPGQGLASSTLGLLGSLRGTPPTVGSPAAPAASDSPRTPGVVQSVAAQRAGGSKGFHGSGVLELIYNDGGKGYGIKNGQVVNGGQVFRDVWAGHTNHVHVAAGPKTVVALGRLAQSMGLHVGENPHFGGVDPVHVPGSFHYKGEAVDVSGDPQKLSKYAQAVEAYNASGRL